MNYQEACNIFRRVSNFYLEHERYKFEKVTEPLFRSICGSKGFGRLTVKISGDGLLELSIHCQEGYTYTTERNFYPGLFPVVYQELRTPEDLAVILSNPKNYQCGLFYSSLVPLLLDLEGFLGGIIKSKQIPYSLDINFKNGKPDYMFFLVNGDPHGSHLSESTLGIIDALKKKHLRRRVLGGTI